VHRSTGIARPRFWERFVYITTPSYISILWTTQFGQFLLVCAGCWMMCGILVMRKMINFKY
jgi:tight adherence protein B